MTGEECTENLLAENKEKVLFWQDEVAILKQNKKEWSSLNLRICFLEGSSHPAYLKTTSFNGEVEKLWGEECQAGRGGKESGKEEAQYVKAREGTFCIGSNNCNCTYVHASLLLGFQDPGEHTEGGWTPFLF